MSRIETRTRYRCDGCGKEGEAVYGWKTVSALNLGNFISAAAACTEDFCDGCYVIMRSSVRPLPTGLKEPHP